MRAAGLALLATGLLLPGAPAGATIVRDGATKPAENTTKVGGAVEIGGQRAARSAPGVIVCTQMAQVPSVAAWLSFPDSAGPAANWGLVVGCALPPDQDYLLRAAAALRLAILEDRAVSWRVGRGRAFGFILPVRNFSLASGLACRSFVHTLNVGRRPFSASGTACLHAGGWRIVPPVR